jgi:hypothetical protein
MIKEEFTDTLAQGGRQYIIYISTCQNYKTIHTEYMYGGKIYDE